MVFKNTRKEKDTHPDYKVNMHSDKGFISVGGGWIKTTKTGDKYISLSIDTEPQPWSKPEGLLTEEENAKIRALKEAHNKPLTNLKDEIPW